MKKFTFMLLAAFIAVAAMAAGPEKRDMKPLDRAAVVTSSAKQLPNAKGVSRSTTNRQKSPRKSLGLVTPPSEATPEIYYTASGKLNVYTSNGWADGGRKTIQVIVDGTDIYISGLAYWVENAWIKGTIDGATATFPPAQQVDDDESYPEWISGSEDGETICDIVFNFDQVNGILECVTTYIGECSDEDAFNVYAYRNQPTFTRDEPAAPEPVVLPDGLEILYYVMSYDGGSKPINVAVDGNDVYFQGMSKYLPEAWVKGTKDGNLVTFPAMQYMGEYGTYGSSYFFYNGETVFTYDEEAKTYTAEGQVFGVIADTYYDGNYTNPVIAPVVEKAAMPANPEVTDFSDSSYGYIVEFNVPLMDVNGEPIVASKLTYMIYTDTEGVIEPLTFTPATHTKLTEDMTEIPYGFTEEWDFYAKYIYLNELYSEDWNKIGIQSIYRGGGETNATEIQWYTIKEYAVQSYTFNFNAMDVPTSSNVSTDGDILEPMTLNEGTVSLTISTKDGSSSENRFWGTSAGPQLRVYSGTLTFSVPTGYGITQIVFNHNGKWGANTINGVEIANDAEAKVATWTLAEGEVPASVVVVAIAANSQINSIDVTVEAAGDKLVVLPSGVEPEAWALEGFYSDGSDGQDVFQATEVAFDGNDIYVKGLADYFEDAWLKGTLDTETGIVTFPSGQFVGEDAYGQEYMVGFDGSDFCDIQYAYDAEAKTLTQVTPFIMESSTKTGLDEEGDLAFWGYWEVSSLHAGAPTALEIVEVPEGLETETYVFSANEWVEESDNPESAARRKALTLQPYTFQIQVGFDGQDVYFKGFTDNTADMWAKGTLSEDGKTVTIPASQYIGLISTWSSNYNYYVTAVNEYYENVDIVLNYDADTNTFTTDQTIVLNGSMFVYYPYQTFTDVTIAKMAEFAATPADPSIDGYKFEDVSYPYINFAIPTTDVNGNDILTSKLFYTVWIESEEDGVEKPFVVLADEYKHVEEDWTEIPYEWNDEYDIYKGGSKFYINPTDALTGWTKFGIQSIYYGGGERHTSNIVWSDGSISESKDAVYAPADLVTETYSFDGFDLDYNANTVREVEVGFYGENVVFIQGLSEYLPDAWVKGTLEAGVLTIPETFLGVYTESDGDWSEDYELTFSGATFTYDGEIGTFYSEDGYVTDDASDDEVFYDRFKYVTLTKIPDVATVPLNPEILDFNYLDSSQPYVKFNIHAVSAIDGSTLIENKLYYQFYYYKDLEVVPLVLTKDLYPELDADMSEIPYGFSKENSVFMDFLYLRQLDQEIDSWYQIGLQTIYYGGGERNVSEIVWWNNDKADGISLTPALSEGKEEIYNVAGQRMNKVQKGINIVTQGSAKANGKKVLIK